MSTVLERFPNLRLNLAHFGSFRPANSPALDPAANFSETWKSEIGGLLKARRFKNVFADISYLSWGWGSGIKDQAKVNRAKKFFEQYFNDCDPNAESLMYGTIGV